MEHIEAVPTQETRLVIAVDYGTTHTGVAWATPSGTETSKPDVIQVWGSQMTNKAKIPSVVSYTKKSAKRERQFGADLSTDAIAMVHTKLQLGVNDVSTELDHILEALERVHNLNFQYLKKNDTLPKHTLLSPERIVGDYLQKVFNYLFESDTKLYEHDAKILPPAFSPDLRALTPVDIVVTVPAEWKYRAKNSTFRALTQAGFNKDEENFPRLGTVMLITEPEAAAVYTARFFQETLGSKFRMRIGEGFVLCDAGGGTVDVVSYKVKRLDPFEIERVGTPAGRKCGAIFINFAFKKWLKELIGERRYHELDPNKLTNKITSSDSEGEMMRKVMADFETRKKTFKGPPESRTMHITLPRPFQDINVDTRVKEGAITITSQDMQKFFEPCRAGVWRLIYNQLEDIKRRGTRPRNVFLVGGFAESPYLQEAIRDSLEAIPELPPVELRVPETSWTAVVRGAVIFGVEKAKNTSMPTMHASPRSYGVMVDKPFSVVEHQPEDLDNSPGSSGSISDVSQRPKLALGQYHWLINRGDLILSNEPMELSLQFDRELTDHGPKHGSVSIVSYDYEDTPPASSRFSNEPGLHKVATVDYDLSRVPIQCHKINPQNRQAHLASMLLKMRIIPGALRVQVCIENREEILGERIIPDSELDDVVCPAAEETQRNIQEDRDRDYRDEVDEGSGF